MTEFRWHLMADECPPIGKGHYIIMGRRGAMYYADSFESVPYMSCNNFHVPNSRDNYKYDHEVKAWAEIPMLGSDDTCHNVAAPPEEGFWPMPHFECSVCAASYVTSEYVYFCPNCGRKVVQP